MDKSPQYIHHGERRDPSVYFSRFHMKKGKPKPGWKPQPVFFTLNGYYVTSNELISGQTLCVLCVTLVSDCPGALTCEDFNQD